MKLQQNTKRYTHFQHRETVYFEGQPFKVFKPAYELESRRPDIHVSVTDVAGRVHQLHFESLEVEVPEVPEPPAKQYESTDYYMDKETGALYKRQFSNNEGGLAGNPVWHLICLNQIRPSIRCPREDNVPASFKRLYKEV